MTLLSITHVRSARTRTGRTIAAAGLLAVLLTACGSLTKTDEAPEPPGNAAGSPVSFTAQTSDGSSVALPGEKPSVLLFFSVECGTCGPTATALAEARATDPTAADYAVVDIAGYETAKDVERFLAANDAGDLPYAIDTDGTLLTDYDIAQLSTVLIVTPDGEVTYRGIEPDAATIRDELAKATES
jgi:glutaredoxin-related protein